ncbi:hypothetical protein QAD02_023989 [Eretmocerus hayati]|uniref:Uncharacterized protein n=1 Tax=Eretmocerus hayati TaxID=131215 RepID=A0ACC2PX42_9HYME|nr:hypothetical protein QAD02_023989 [Eretmocerus hayati]
MHRQQHQGTSSGTRLLLVAAAGEKQHQVVVGRRIHRQQHQGTSSGTSRAGAEARDVGVDPRDDGVVEREVVGVDEIDGREAAGVDGVEGREIVEVDDGVEGREVVGVDGVEGREIVEIDDGVDGRELVGVDGVEREGDEYFFAAESMIAAPRDADVSAERCFFLAYTLSTSWENNSVSFFHCCWYTLHAEEVALLFLTRLLIATVVYSPYIYETSRVETSQNLFQKKLFQDVEAIF